MQDEKPLWADRESYTQAEAVLVSAAAKGHESILAEPTRQCYNKEGHA